MLLFPPYSNTDGCRYFSVGSSQCRHHALFCISAMCYLCFSSTWSGITLSDCAAVLCHFRHSEFGISSAVTVTVLAVLCALVSILFCISLHYSEAIYRKFIKNPYLRAAAGGCIIILLTLLVGNQDYNGTGVNIISKCFDGTVAPEAFLLKIIFTALTLGAGFKGGEIVPTFFIGASFGCLFGTLTGFSPTLSAAIGMAAIFCGVTNSPITSLLISFEMFGFAAMPFLLLAIAFSYMLSGYYGLYRSQKIMYSKFKTSYINKQTH